MKNILIVGSPDRGKSFLTKQILTKFQKAKDGTQRLNYIYDINNEHRKFPNEVDKYFKGGVGIHEFLDFVTAKDANGVTKIQKSNLVFEEATVFFSNSGNLNTKIIDLLSRRFHTQNLNILLFHSLRKVPLDILDFTDFFFMFKTEDMLNNVEKKFSDHPKVVQYFKEIQAKTAGTEFNREKKLYKDQRSKDFFHYHKCIAR